MTFSRRFSEYVISHRYEQMSADAIMATKLAILDWLGSAIAGGLEKPAKILSETLNTFGGLPQSTNFVTFEKTSVHYASLINGGASHILELDDVHKASILHAGASIIPAAFAVAEWKQATGRELIEAVALGFEVAIRIGEAVSPSHYEIFHTTGTVGTFGATVAVGKLLGLSVDEMVHALGSAGTQAAGLWEFIEDGAMSKQLHPAKACSNGLLAAALAKQQFTAASQILEGRRGFFAGLVKEVKEELLFHRLGEGYKIMENTYKIHSCCRHIHPTLDCVQEIFRENGSKIEEVERVVVETYQVALNITDKPDPRSVFESKFSLPYAAALMLVKGKTGLDEFTEENLFNPKIRRLTEKVNLRVDPALDALYPNLWPSRVTVHYADGTKLTKETHAPKGDPENPAGELELRGKFLGLAGKVISEKQAKDIADTIMNLEDVENVSTVFS
ncbi:MmgE/PrpD family protein [Ammoniphilus resinae]|uniref:2-methylcitrate dehydratase PrpD n=1 Tax=Ammoniphilus resinae TaxID=861532 RepID=A0ABS4GLW8_9BACL|nr:MmgE/PrpD family protein [Ammoniphilus resinae]MBP1931246.1 2-methylcitrate dehydratase PrpD [Ammoniphilus resinae]